MCDSPGIAHGCICDRTTCGLSAKTSRNANVVTPAASTLFPTPTTIWSAFAFTESSAMIDANTMPAATPHATPRYRSPVAQWTRNEKNAPASMKPSKPMLITPARSAISSPPAAKISGVANVIVVWSQFVSKGPISPPPPPPPPVDEPPAPRDEHDHQPLRDLHQGGGGTDLRLHDPATLAERRQQQRRRDRTERRVARQERGHDAVEAVVRGEAVRHGAGGAGEDERRACQPGHHPRQDERHHRHRPGPDARAPGGGLVPASDAQAHPERRPLQEELHGEGHGQGDREVPVQVRAVQQRGPPGGVRH